MYHAAMAAWYPWDHYEDAYRQECLHAFWSQIAVAFLLAWTIRHGWLPLEGWNGNAIWDYDRPDDLHRTAYVAKRRRHV